MTLVRIPPALRPEVGGRRNVTIEAATVHEALRKLVAEFPALDGRVLADDSVPPYLNLFVDGDDVRLHEGLDTPLGPDSSLVLLPAVAGGSGGGHCLKLYFL